MSLYCKYKYKPLAGLVVLLAKPKTGFCDHKRATHNESRLHNERRGKNDHCFARSINYDPSGNATCALECPFTQQFVYPVCRDLLEREIQTCMILDASILLDQVCCSSWMIFQMLRTPFWMTFCSQSSSERSKTLNPVSSSSKQFENNAFALGMASSGPLD